MGNTFDAKVPRQSLSAEDLIAAHVGGMDICARGFEAAVAMREDGGLDKMLKERCAGWDAPAAADMLKSDLGCIAARVLSDDIRPEPKSGRQEILEKYVNRFV